MMINPKLLHNDETIFKFKSIITHLEIPISRIYLFGSRAKGNQNPDSDYDFLVLLANIKDNDLVKKYPNDGELGQIFRKKIEDLMK